jgi:hypothetical protein
MTLHPIPYEFSYIRENLFSFLSVLGGGSDLFLDGSCKGHAVSAAPE